MTKKQFIQEILPFGEKIYRVSFRFLKDSEKARDMVQNIFCKLWDTKEKLKSIENREAYLMRITRNACLDSIRLRKYTIELEQHHRTSEPGFEMRESVELIKKVIATLPEKQRLIIELRDVEELSYEEIAEIMDLPSGTLRVSLSIARKKVREALTKIYNYGT